MNKRPAPFLWVFFSLIFLLSCSGEQTDAIFEKHLEKYPDVSKKYLYQSVLRLANVKHDPNFDKFIKYVTKVTIYFPPAGDSTYQIKDLRTEIRSSGYEELFDVRTADKERINLWVNESFKKPHYVGLLDTSEEDYVFEIDGQVDLEYVSAFNIADQKSLREFLNW